MKIEIEELSIEELSERTESKTEGVFYYIGSRGQYMCYLITKSKSYSNVWTNKKMAFNWMNNVLNTHFRT